MANILIVDDERPILKTLALLLKREGYEVETAYDIPSAKDVLGKIDIDVVITDLRLGESSGADLIKYIQDETYPVECIVMTAYGSIESAVQCMQIGAYDYLTKPVNPEELIVRVRRVIEKKRLSDEIHRLRAEIDIRGTFNCIVSKSPQMVKIVDIIQRIRNLDMPVLITGETGTGKEIVAHAIHNISQRTNDPFLAINCCALPESLLDTELFGHLKGAFTGATNSSKGLFQQADGGTLFLDEIGDISLQLQSKLLRVLQEGEVRPVGSNTTHKVNVRIIAATNRDLPAMISRGEFRSDLFFRLNVVPISIPPLRERPEDIRPLVERTLLLLKERMGPDMPALSKEAWQKLLMYNYPGNVRQLENIVERTFALAQGPIIGQDDIYLENELNEINEPAHVEPSETSDTVDLDDLVVRHIRRVLELHKGNQVNASRALGISRSTLRRKLGLN